MWTPVGSDSYDSMTDGRAALKKLEGGLWKWSTTPGNGFTSSRFMCNKHKKCKRELKCQLCQGKYIILGKGEHEEEINDKKRKNSTLTIQEESRVRESMDQGGRPAGLLVAMHNTKARELRAEGEDPLDHKDDNGGLLGEIIRRPTPVPFGYMRILHVF